MGPPSLLMKLQETPTVEIVPMRRRHLRAVLRIEQQVYPRPWSTSLFLSELALRSTRAYFVARVGRELVGYAGLMMTLDDGHVTTIAVDPTWHENKIGTRLLLWLAREAIARGAKSLTLGSAHHQQRRARPLPASSGSGPSACARTTTRRSNEDALVMWAHDVDQPAYAELLDSIERQLPGATHRRRTTFLMFVP